MENAVTILQYILGGYIILLAINVAFNYFGLKKSSKKEFYARLGFLQEQADRLVKSIIIFVIIIFIKYLVW